ncbi:alpha/beta fold hydrolase [Caulobacter hibisci]|uniref:Alpha/beta fold hydrolase n=2 Tax=Caulobacter hibisci TaxID=2035993 RepID=A0ABS0SZU4_9CAUL|nr:alpha/beta fold hydrolase [Caulobacter hibisci]MBI1684112.1 alpha/beta fold hydrolase [Caulobacter hibisci]
MLHGGGPGATGPSNYSRNLAALSQSYRLLIPDMPGYGGSTKGVSRSDPFGDLAGAMLELLDGLGVKRAHAIGNSLGGACALRLALDHPDRVDRLVLMGPGGVDTTRSLPTKGLQKLLNYYKGDGPSLEKLRAFIDDLVYEPSDIPDTLLRERYEASIDPETVASPPLMRPKGFKLRDVDFTRDPRLAGLNNPVLVLWGQDDRVNRPSGGTSLIRRLPNADLHLFSRTGHWVQWERADTFNAITLAFLAQRSL